MTHEFQRIYVEHEARNYDSTGEVLGKFPGAVVIDIENYKQIFGRPRQDWALQKQNPSLVLAVKKGNFLYPGADTCPSFGHRDFYYNTPILNCVYNCRYCYLQGMYPSAHIVAFVNDRDFFSETEKVLRNNGNMYLCLSYETDLVAFEGVIPNCSRWIKFAARHAGLTIEIRTKHADVSFLDSLSPVPGVIFAWTLSPDEISRQYEEKAPPLAARLAAMKETAEKGWKVRVCIDPVLRVPGWKSLYGNLFEEIFAVLKPEEIYDVYTGTFRMNHEYFKRIKANDPLSPLFHGDFERNGDVVMYPADFREEVAGLVPDGFSLKKHE